MRNWWNRVRGRVWCENCGSYYSRKSEHARNPESLIDPWSMGICARCKEEKHLVRLTLFGPLVCKNCYEEIVAENEARESVSSS